MTERADDHDRRQRQRREVEILATTTADGSARRAATENVPLDDVHGTDRDLTTRRPMTINDATEESKAAQPTDEYDRQQRQRKAFAPATTIPPATGDNGQRAAPGQGQHDNASGHEHHTNDRPPATTHNMRRLPATTATTRPQRQPRDDLDLDRIRLQTTSTRSARCQTPTPAT